MAKTTDTRENMILAAVRLLQERGPTASGVADIVAEAGAPRGSIYHHFPGGKDEILIEAVARARESGLLAIAAADAQAASAENFIERVARIFRAAPEAASWQSGCPVAATAVEGDHQSAAVRETVAKTFDVWVDAISQGLTRKGLEAEAAQDLGYAVIAAVEGAILTSRASGHSAPYDATMRILRQVVELASGKQSIPSRKANVSDSRDEA